LTARRPARDEFIDLCRAFSPLWYIAVYLALVLLAPLAIRLHQRFGPLVVVVMVGVAALVDVLRFGQHLAWAALLKRPMVAHAVSYSNPEELQVRITRLAEAAGWAP
jgi:hypothetical protein